jgi:type II restriction enzyme
MWANFGPVVQVKHLTLTDELAEDICEEVAADRIVIVCKDSERETIERVCQQLGQRIQGVIVQSQLVQWYEQALRGDFASRLGDDLLNSLRQEFRNEFPYSTTFEAFYKERGYDRVPQSSSPFWCGD